MEKAFPLTLSKRRSSRRTPSPFSVFGLCYQSAISKRYGILFCFFFFFFHLVWSRAYDYIDWLTSCIFYIRLPNPFTGAVRTTRVRSDCRENSIFGRWDWKEDSRWSLSPSSFERPASSLWRGVLLLPRLHPRRDERPSNSRALQGETATRPFLFIKGTIYIHAHVGSPILSIFFIFHCHFPIQLEQIWLHRW